MSTKEICAASLPATMIDVAHSGAPTPIISSPVLPREISGDLSDTSAVHKILKRDGIVDKGQTDITYTSAKSGKPKVPFDNLVSWSAIAPAESKILISVFVIPPHGSCITFSPEHDEVLELTGYRRDGPGGVESRAPSVPQVLPKQFENESSQKAEDSLVARKPTNEHLASVLDAYKRNVLHGRTPDTPCSLDSSALFSPSGAGPPESPFFGRQGVTPLLGEAAVGGSHSSKEIKTEGGRSLHPTASISSGRLSMPQHADVSAAKEAKKFSLKRRENSGIVQLYRHKVSLMRWRLWSEKERSKQDAAKTDRQG